MNSGHINDQRFTGKSFAANACRQTNGTKTSDAVRKRGDNKFSADMPLPSRLLLRALFTRR